MLGGYVVAAVMLVELPLFYTLTFDCKAKAPLEIMLAFYYLLSFCGILSPELDLVKSFIVRDSFTLVV